MVTKCFRKGCNFSEEAAHMDDALDRLRHHYRAIHPTKVFYEHDFSANLEAYNLTVDEILEQNNVAAPENAPQYDWRHLRAQVQQWRRSQERDGRDYLAPDVLDEVERRVNEHYINQEVQAEAHNPFAQALRGVRGADVYAAAQAEQAWLRGDAIAEEVE